MTYFDIHVLQTVPPSNINRDDSGSPKTAVYGGVRRARVSSQAWKRAVRKAFEADPATRPEAGTRTRRLPQVIADELARRVPELAPHKDLAGLAATNAMFKLDLKKRGDNKRPESEYLLFLGRRQLDQVVERLAAATSDLVAAGDEAKAVADVVARLGLADLGVTGHPGAVALFGRMVADAPDVNVDAACQVAHAISTHAVETEFDYFTAVDDELGDAETGAGMIGTIEFNSATLYRYATVDLEELATNLDDDRDRALDLAVAFGRAFALSMPTGKQNTFANHTRPDFAMVAVRGDQPVNLVGAYERPVLPRQNGLMVESVAALLRYWTDQESVFGTAPAFVAASYPSWLGEEVNKIAEPYRLPAPVAFEDALTGVRAALAEGAPR